MLLGIVIEAVFLCSWSLRAVGGKGEKTVLMQPLCTLAAISKLQTPMPLCLLSLETKKKSNAML
jgi:hypothetical protein